MIVKSFQFVPLGNPVPALLANPKRAGSQAEFGLNCQPDWRYQIQSSGDLSTWQILAEVLATNFFQDFVDPFPATSSSRFYRVVTLP
jgi:hypothetical protein